jgi:hypothetical protein
MFLLNIFFSIKAKRKGESLSTQLKKTQEKNKRYKSLFFQWRKPGLLANFILQYLVPQSKYGSLPSTAKRSEYTALVRAGMIWFWNVFSKILANFFVMSVLGFTALYQGKNFLYSNIAYFSEDERLKKTVRRLQGRVRLLAKWRLWTFDLYPWGEGHGVQVQICDILRP